MESLIAVDLISDLRPSYLWRRGSKNVTTSKCAVVWENLKDPIIGRRHLYSLIPISAGRQLWNQEEEVLVLTITSVWSVYPRPVIDGMGCQLCRDVLSTYLRQTREHNKLLLFCGRLFYHSKKCTNCKFHSPYWRLWERIHRFRHLRVCRRRWAVAPSPWFLEEQRRSVKLDFKS